MRHNRLKLVVPEDERGDGDRRLDGGARGHGDAGLRRTRGCTSWRPMKEPLPDDAA